MHLFLIISINLYGRNSIKFNTLTSRDVIVLNVIIIPIHVMGIIRSKFARFLDISKLETCVKNIELYFTNAW